jgi:hypothetical protein
MKDLDINKCVRRTPAPDWFKAAMAKGQMPIFGKLKGVSKNKFKNVQQILDKKKEAAE